MKSHDETHSNAASRAVAESLYAGYLEQAGSLDAVSFEAFLVQHPEHGRELREIHAGLAFVQAATQPESDSRSLELGYELLEALGEGGHGTVHRARDRALDCDVAIKTFEQGGASLRDRRRFLAEARAMARVRHENVVRIHAVDEVDGAIRLIMELIDGRTLEELVEVDGTLSAREAAQVGIDLCRALGALHQAEMIHMDVKPGNVMRERGGRTVLLDFGLVRSPQLDDERVGGTPPFMAPEHFGQGSPGPSTDIYGLGATLYWLVSGRYPLEANTIGELREGILAGRTTPLVDASPSTPREFAAIVEKAMSARPEERYGSAGYFERALREFVGAQSAARSTAGRRGLLAAGAIGVAALAALLWPTSPLAKGGLQVQAALTRHRSSANAPAQVVREPSTLRVGDGLSLEVEAPEPCYVYLFNEDEAGRAFTLFPRGEPRRLAADVRHRLPEHGGTWRVDSAGGTEHMFLVVSTQPDPFAEELRRRVQAVALTGADFRVSQLDSETRGALRSATRGIGSQAPGPAAPHGAAAQTPQGGLGEAPGPEQSLADLFAAYEAYAAHRSGLHYRHWSIAHDESPAR